MLRWLLCLETPLLGYISQCIWEREGLSLSPEGTPHFCHPKKQGKCCSPLWRQYEIPQA